MMTKDDDRVLEKDDDQVSDWTKGLPSNEELTPLSHTLISRILSSAFRIKHDDPMTAEDVQRESQATLRNLFNQKSTPSFDAFPAFQEEEDAGGYGYGREGRRVEEEFRGKRRVEDDFRGVRAEDEFRDEFRGNQRVEDREDSRGIRRAEVRRDGRPHAVEDRMDYRGASRLEIPRLPSAGSGTDTTGQEMGGVKSNVGVGGPRVQGVQSPAMNAATNSGREYSSAPTKPGNDTNNLEDRAERPGQSPSPFMTNALSYGPYESRGEAGSYANGKDVESSRGADLEPEDANSAGEPANSNEDPNAKRTRLVWTPQLHKRFVEAVGHLGIKNAVPKTIMQLMNVEGLKRENVASHLQKYRLYLKRMQGLSSDEPSASDYLFASTPLPPGMSPHFMPNSANRDDVGGVPFPTPILPMGFPGLVRPGPFGGYEHLPYGAMAGGYMQQTPMLDPRMAVNVSENESRSHAGGSRHVNHRSQSHQNQSNSSSQCELPLFPTNGNRR
ncbi:hypothetical protein KC19_8G148000 [Ceratodon purpureus]|uniref:HTH myb-type domain-containing protein n=1 Tax=Ceratodon purpureus TaxID=3225 RepID=A0A8T0H446_CERPU|nr:hypothetical protein KC19_8G148000 [Ceratodon purpureus]